MKKIILSTLAVIISVIIIRVILEPAESQLPFVKFKDSDIPIVKSVLPNSLLSIADVSIKLHPKRILLIGENHFVTEPQIYLTKLLEQLNDSSLVILLELSEDSQKDIDTYLASGDEKYLEAVFKKSNNLPLEYILRWSFKNKNRIRRVVAFDQNFWHVGINRLFLTDSRNETMAQSVYSAYEKFPNSRIIAYGGQMHMLKGGRYRYDKENREPIFIRLKKFGVSDSVISSVMLSGQMKFPLDSIWKTPGAILSAGVLGKLPYEYFINYPVFGVKTAEELSDIFVNLGGLTEISTNK